MSNAVDNAIKALSKRDELKRIDVLMKRLVVHVILDKRERDRERERERMAIHVDHFCISKLNLNYEKKMKPTSRPKSCNIVPRRSVQAVLSSSGKELVQSGTVRAIPGKDAIPAMKNDGFLLLDIRPVWEREKAHVPESLHVPLFVHDTDNSPVTLLKKWVHFGYIGLWTGQKFTTINSEFIRQVEMLVPDKDAKILVACGEGLRSLMAVSRLHEGGYRELGWLIGGFNLTGDDDFPAVAGKSKLKYATIGGVSFFFLQLLMILQAVDNKKSS